MLLPTLIANNGNLDYLMVQGSYLMHVSVSSAKAQLTDLVRRAEAGDDVVLTRHGHPAVRLVPVAVQRKPTAAEKLAVLDKYHGILKGRPGFEDVTGQNISDFLYDEDGLPA